jgi:hypothetical protein
MMKAILLKVPVTMKMELDAKQAEGYSLNGFIRRAIATALHDDPAARRRPKRPGRR